jgi:hypothetical protein
MPNQDHAGTTQLCAGTTQQLFHLGQNAGEQGIDFSTMQAHFLKHFDNLRSVELSTSKSNTSRHSQGLHIIPGVTEAAFTSRYSQGLHTPA